MKLLCVGILVLVAFISFSSCQYPLSKAFIQNRARIIAENFRWYQRLDASYFDFYEKLRNTLERTFRPFKPVFDEFNVVYTNFDQSELTEETARNLTNFISRVNQTLFYTSEYAPRFSMMQYSMSLMMPDYLSPAAAALKNAIMMPLNSVFSFFTMTLSPPSDLCTNKILSKFVPTYEPYAKKMLDSAKQGIAEIPKAFSNVTSLAKSATAEWNLLIKKIKSCSKSSSKQVCVDEIVQKYVVCDNVQPCSFDQLISKPMMEISMATMELQKIYSASPMVSWSMELNDKINELKATC